MKNCVIFFDCHGMEIKKYLFMNKNLKKDFNIEFIRLNDYVVKNMAFFDNTKLDNKHIMLIENADILILQVIEKNRGFLNNSEVIKFCNSDCKVIKIPHYRNSIYQYKCIENKINKYDLGLNSNGENSWNLPKKIKDLNNINETKKIIQNEIDIMNNFKYDEDEMFKSMNYKINEFEKMDSLSDIKMLDYFNNNFKKYKLFQGRSYPSSLFFFELTNRILYTLEYEHNVIFEDLYFAQHRGEPIPEYWYNFCKFSFDNTYYTFGNLPITECEWYYILLLSNNVNIVTKKEILQYLKIIRQSAF